MSTAQTANGTDVVIYRSANGNGETFALDSRSLERLREKFGSALDPRPRVFVASEGYADREHVLGRIIPQVLALLTGLSEEMLRALGRVTVRDPVTERDVPLTPA